MARLSVTWGNLRLTVRYPADLSELVKVLAADLSGLADFAPGLEPVGSLGASVSASATLTPPLAQTHLFAGSMSASATLTPGVEQTHRLGADFSTAAALTPELAQTHAPGAALSASAGISGDLSPKATLVADFENGVYAVDGTAQTLAQTLDFTRASTALYWDASGVLQEAATDELRIDHDPDSGNKRGALIEASRTNELLDAADFTAASDWGGDSDFTITTATSAISGETAYKHENDGSGGGKKRDQTVGTLTGSDETVSAIIENEDAGDSLIGIRDTTASAWVIRAKFDWSTEAASVESGSGTVGWDDLGTGPNGGKMIRLWATGSGTSANNRAVQVFPTGASTNTKKAILHHAQHEEAGSRTSPIVTTSAPVTRAVDDLSASAGSWFDAAKGTFSAVVDYGVTDDSAPRIVAGEAADSPLFLGAIAERAGMWNGSQVLNKMGLTSGPGIKKLASSYDGSGRSVTGEGATPASDANAAFSTTPSALGFGSQNSFNSFLNGHIRRVVYYPERLSDSELEDITS